MKAWIDIGNPPQVQYLAPFVEAFERRGHEVVVTARPYGITAQLLTERDVPHRVIGTESGRSRLGQLSRTAVRALRLAVAVSRSGRPALLLSTSRSGALAAWMLRVPSFMVLDYEHAELGSFRALGTTVMHPEVIDGSILEAKGFAPEKLIAFAGIKEDITFAGRDIDAVAPHDFGLPRDGASLVLVRPPSESAHYFEPESRELTRAVLAKLAADPAVRVIFSPRHPHQVDELAKHSWHNAPIVIERPIEFVALLKGVDAVIGGGGTMLREAAYLGLPAVSLFRSETGRVDRWLEEVGALTIMSRAEDIERLKWRRDTRIPTVAHRPEVIDTLTERMLAAVDRPARHRVLMVGPDPASKGGIATATEFLREGPLGRLHEVDYVATSADGSRAHKLRTASKGAVQIARSLAGHRPDVVHLHTSSGTSFVRKGTVVVAARCARIPVILHVHASDFDTFYDDSPRAGRFAIRKVLELADAVVVLSQEWAQEVRRRAPRAVTAVVANAVPVPPRTEREGTRGGPIVTLGRLGERKGTYDLLHALTSTNHDVETVLAGDGDVEGVAGLAARLGLRDVQVRSWVGPADKDDLLRRAACFVLPSYAEGLPMALLEAMARGIPVVTTPVGGIAGLVTQGVTGLLVAPGDRHGIAQAIDRVLGDDEFAARIGESGRARVLDRHSLEVQAERLTELYAKVAPRRTRFRSSSSR